MRKELFYCRSGSRDHTYPLGHRIKESWGRAVVEAMLTGCVPVVPAGHQFHKLMPHGETGFICQEFSQFKAAVRELCENYPLRMKMGRLTRGTAKMSRETNGRLQVQSYHQTAAKFQFRRRSFT